MDVNLLLGVLLANAEILNIILTGWAGEQHLYFEHAFILQR